MNTYNFEIDVEFFRDLLCVFKDDRKMYGIIGEYFGICCSPIGIKIFLTNFVKSLKEELKYKSDFSKKHFIDGINLSKETKQFLISLCSDNN